MRKQKRLLIVKIGGGLVAPKQWPENTPDRETIAHVVEEIKAVWKRGNLDIIVINGQGNFAHNPAKKYGVAKGFDNDDSEKKWGACFTQAVAAKINALIVDEMLAAGMPAAAVSPHDIWVETKEGKVSNTQAVWTVLKKGILPVLYGDVIWNEEKGCVIYSGDVQIGYLAGEAKQHGYAVGPLVHLSLEKGVYGKDGEVIEEITELNWEELKIYVAGAAEVDVTGGMVAKVEEGLVVTRTHGVSVVIASGREKGVLSNLVDGGRSGTKISR